MVAHIDISRGSASWFRLARLAKLLSSLTLVWLGIDVGCGTGSLVFVLPEIAKIEAAIGVALAARCVEAARARNTDRRITFQDTVHRSDHLFACGGVEPVRGTGPRPAGMISIEGVNLNVDDWHGAPPACSTNCPPS